MKDTPANAVILLVEDDFDLASLFQLAARKAGVEARVVTVPDGEAAINYVSRRPPFNDDKLYPPATHILLDLKLPRRTGVEVLQWLRSNGQAAGNRVIVWTAFQDSHDAVAARRLGVDALLVKPGGLDALVSLVRDMATLWGIPQLDARRNAST